MFEVIFGVTYATLVVVIFILMLCDLVAKAWKYRTATSYLAVLMVVVIALPLTKFVILGSMDIYKHYQRTTNQCKENPCSTPSST